MALSGSFSNYPTGKFGLYCEWSGSQSVTGNYTNITLKVYLQFYTPFGRCSKRLYDLHQRNKRNLYSGGN